MSGPRLISILISLCGLFAIFCAAKDYSWFMEHRKAKALSNLIGRGWTRVFYITLGLALFVAGVIFFLNPIAIES